MKNTKYGLSLKGCYAKHCKIFLKITATKINNSAKQENICKKLKIRQNTGKNRPEMRTLWENAVKTLKKVSNLPRGNFGKMH